MEGDCGYRQGGARVVGELGRWLSGLDRNVFFFCQAEDGIRDAQESRGLGDVYKRQERARAFLDEAIDTLWSGRGAKLRQWLHDEKGLHLSLIHI